MKKKLDNYQYDTILFPSDWRYSSAVIGLKLYFDYMQNVQGYYGLYKKIKIENHSTIIDDAEELIGFEGIAYNSSDLTEERYLQFAEDFFSEDMQHKKVEKKLEQEEFSEEDIKNINGLLTGTESNTVLKKVFKGIKFDGTNAEVIRTIIEDNRFDIVRETFRYKTNMYRNFANTNLLFTQENIHCRLVGFNVDKNRKSKSTSYNFDANTLVANDCIEFDYIPFGFTKTYDSIMINNNYSIELLMSTYRMINQALEIGDNRRKVKTTLLRLVADSSDFLNYDVEVILKSRDKDYFETIYLRESAIKAMKTIDEKLKSNHKSMDDLNFRYELGKDYWLNVQDEIVNSCINSLGFEALIEQLLKIKESGDKGTRQINRTYLSGIIYRLIAFDTQWKGEINQMENKNRIVSEEEIKKARNCAYVVAKSIPENKLSTYRQKLISALVFHDYDRVCEIILQLSGYAGVSMPFAYKLFENPEENKNLAFAFANGLEKYQVNNEGKKENIEG